jgi:hypothetical protein
MHSRQRKPYDLPVVMCLRSRQVTLETDHLHPQRWHTSRDRPSSPRTPSQRFMTLVSPTGTGHREPGIGDETDEPNGQFSGMDSGPESTGG